jgi:hypothetical protein
MNRRGYLTAVLTSRKKKDKSTSTLEQELSNLQKEKERHINNLLLLKSAFSIIDDMFMKEMENAEEYTCLQWLFCWCKTVDKRENPKKLSTFVEDVMDPYGRQDKYLSELKEVDDKTRVDKLNKDAVFYFVKTDPSVNTMTISGTEPINGAATLVISTQYQSYTLQSDGTNWHIL